MKVVKTGLTGAAAVFAAMLAGQSVAAGFCGKGPHAKPYGYSGYGMPHGRPHMIHPRYGHAYGYRHPMSRGYRHGGYGKPGGYAMNRDYRAGYGPAAAATATQTATTSAEATKSASITISQMRFDAPTVTVKAGGTVTWVNQEGAPHTVTATDGSFASPQLTAGDSFSHTFDQPGTYTYYCEVHPMMKATIVVEA